MLGLGSNISKAPSSGATIVTDNLVLRHGYAVNPVRPLSDGAAYFDGSDSFVSAATLTFTDSMSFACWVKADASAAGTIISSREDASNAIVLGINSDIVDARFIGANTIQRVSSTWSNQVWNHIAIVCDSGTATTGLSIYVNGVLNNGGTTNALPIPTHALTHIGIKRSGSSSYNSDFEGYVCNVGVWNDLLTQAEIKSIMWKKYGELTTSETANLINWWALDEGTGTSAADSKGSLTGTLTA